jgi:AraC family transcriptional regulator, regulatory protein of adaptative response / methylated-DNA-[protein]-cysteine methyltransferase
MSDPYPYVLVEKAIRFLTTNFRKQPSLEDVAEQIHMSPFHLQRTFTEWAGISPKKFVQYLTLEALKQEVKSTENLIMAAEKVGLSSQSRVYDLFVSMEAVTPGEYKKRGLGMVIDYGIHASPFGNCFVAVTQRGICAMGFVNGSSDAAVNELKQQWELAEIQRNQAKTASVIEQVFDRNAKDTQFRVLVKGSDFQVKVWEALLRIPFGHVASYQGIADAAGKPTATRAVGTAIAHNPVAYLIPCHRVIRSEGIIGNYRWNPGRKAAMIGWEKAVLVKSEK